MKEHTIYVFQNGEKLGGLGFNFPPSQFEVANAKDSFVFRRGDTRIFVLVVTGYVTLDQARQFAINYFEGRTKRINFNDAARIDRDAALWRGLQFT